jgi:ATP-dependent phosphofructokinase / diphosphate-dependent phosphofructokinase
MKIGVLTGGGDCPGLNAAIRAVARSAIASGNQPVGILDGYRGLASRTYIDLDGRAVAGILALGGTILGTSSFEPHTEGAVGELRGAFTADRLDAVIAIGGEHTMEVTRRLHAEEELPVIGVPKTIDNDVVGTDYTVGFDTAVTVAVEAIDRIHTTAQSHNRVMVVEVMGRQAGWIAVHSGLASGADAILIPEVDLTVEALTRQIVKRHERGKDFSIIVAAEGAKLSFESGEVREVTSSDRTDEYGYARLGGIGVAIAEQLEQRSGYETRVTVLGHMQRGGTPTARDRILATRLGAKAHDMANAGEYGRMAAVRGNDIISVPLSDVTGVKPVDLSLLEIAGRFFG